MMRRLVAACAALALAPAALAAPPATQGERLISPPLRSFIEVLAGTNKFYSIRKHVPHGQTLHRWKRMVTTQRFTGYAERMTAEAYARTLAGQLPQACAELVVSPIVPLTVSGRPAAQFQVDCPLAQGDEPETALVLVIAGKTDMHVKQVALRGALPGVDLAWARNYLAATVFCEANDAQDVCRGVIPAS